MENSFVTLAVIYRPSLLQLHYVKALGIFMKIDTYQFMYIKFEVFN